MTANMNLCFKDNCDNMVKLDIQNNHFYFASSDEISVYSINSDLINILSPCYTLATEEEFNTFTQNTPFGYVSKGIAFNKNVSASLLLSQSQFASC
jgi:hypothetical protein